MDEDIVFTYRRASRPHQRFTSSTARFGVCGLVPRQQGGSSTEAGQDGNRTEDQDINQFRFRRRTKPEHDRTFVADRVIVFIHRCASNPRKQRTFSSAGSGKREPTLRQEKESTRFTRSCRKLVEDEDPTQFRFWKRNRRRFTSDRPQKLLSANTPGVGSSSDVSDAERVSAVTRSEGGARSVWWGHAMTDDAPVAGVACEAPRSAGGRASEAATVSAPFAVAKPSDPSQASPAEAPESRGFDLSMFMKPGQWKCDVCLVKNDHDASKCAACESQRPGSATAPGTSSGSTSSGALTDALSSDPLLVAPSSGSGFTFGVLPAGMKSAVPPSTSGSFTFDAPSADASVPASAGSMAVASGRDFIFGAPLDSQVTPPTASRSSPPGGFIFGVSSPAASPAAAPAVAITANPSGSGFIFSIPSQAPQTSPGTPSSSPALPMEPVD